MKLKLIFSELVAIGFLAFSLAIGSIFLAAWTDKTDRVMVYLNYYGEQNIEYWIVSVMFLLSVINMVLEVRKLVCRGKPNG